MAAPKIVIVTPAPPGSRSGNRNTTVRWSRILRALGCRVATTTHWEGEHCDCLIALHARKSAPSLEAFVSRCPGRPAVLALTGTDLYRDIHHDAAAQAALRQATRLVVLQECAPLELDEALRAKVRVIYQSETAHGAWQPPRRHVRLCVLGHLREEKDPFRAALALGHLEHHAAVEVVHAGKALSEEMAREARRLMGQEPRYRWIGELPHWRALRLMLRSHAMVISSRMEGGAHVVSEAIAAGVPVIASDIPGNRGMLGADYPGYYPVEDEGALAGLIERIGKETSWLMGLAEAVARRRPLVAPERERDAWRCLLREIGLAYSN